MSVDLQRKRDLGKILDDSFALYRAHWRTLLAIALVVVVPVDLIVFGLGLGWLWEGYQATPKGHVRVGDVTDSVVGLVAQLLVVTPLVTAMTVHVVREAGAGRAATTREALRAGVAIFGPMIGAVLLVALGVTAGLFLLIIPGLILAVRLVVVPQVVVLEDRRGGDALGRSMELTRGQGWFAFVVVLVTNLLVAVFTQLLLVPLEYAAKQADAQAIDIVGQMLGAIISLPILGVAYTLLYYALLANRAPQEAAPTPPSAPPPATLPGVPGTYGDGYAPPTPPER